MKTINRDVGRSFVLPFYIFITLLLGYLGGTAVRSVWLGGARGLAALAAVLLIVHVGLYWVNYVWTDKSRGWWFFYYPAQTALMVGIMFLLQVHSPGVLSFFFSTTICIVGEALGVWGNSRRSLLLGIFYIGLLVGLLFVLSERAEFYGAMSGLLVNGGAVILFMVLYNQQLSERQKAIDLAESLESANAKLAAYSARIESLTLQNERQRMARELHDTLAQGVAGLVLQLEAVKNHLQTGHHERALSIVEQSLKRARGTLADSRAAIDDLRNPSPDLADLVREKVDRFIQATSIPCRLELSLRENGLSPEIADHTVSILSETLANITRHAQATEVQVMFSQQEGQLELEVRDNGRGFDGGGEIVEGHYGLLGMRERARLSGGVLNVESHPGRGTCIRFRIFSENSGASQ
jgi:NarL family two-component system sensor histidine kinase YdfH